MGFAAPLGASGPCGERCCGEKDAREMLDPDTVVAASVRHATRLGTLIRGLTGAYLPALAALVLSVILLLWTIVDQTGIATVIAAPGRAGGDDGGYPQEPGSHRPGHRRRVARGPVGRGA
jgi:hypothetical protein